MAWEWVAPIAAAVTGVAGIGFTFYAGKQSRDQTERLNGAAQTHDLELARLNRRFDAYVDALDVAEQLGNWAQSLHPILDTNPPRPLPPVPEISVQTRAAALIQAHGTRLARAKMDDWNFAFDQVRVKSELLAFEQQHHVYDGPADGSPWIQIFTAKGEGAKARKELARQLNIELTGDTDPPPQD